MPLQFREITEENYQEFIELEVKPDQKDCFFFKSTKPNMMTLAQAYVFKGTEVLAIYDGGSMIGGVYFDTNCGIEDERTIAWLTRLMIDQKYQGNGYGRRAMEMLINRIKMANQGKSIRLGLSYEPENELAKSLYSSLGFKSSDEMVDDQVVVWLDIDP